MADSEKQNEGWEQVLEKLVLSSLREQKRARQWGVFFKSLTFFYLFILLFFALGWLGESDLTMSRKHTAIVDLRGVISPDSFSSADNIATGLQNAFKDTKTQGVILRINSPGGSPVQAGYINDEIRRLRAEYPDIPLYAVVEDVCASGGYYVAAAADRIYVDKASLIGSIGVLMNGFGFTSAMEKLGIERRLLTAGENKAFLDPFSPSNPEQEEYAQKILNEIHEQFIQVVQEGRGHRLKGEPDLYSGKMWTGQKSVDLGLADGLGSAEYVAREVIKAENIVDFTTREGLTERFVRRFGAAAAETLVSIVSGWGLR